jgi:hypothetical protein
VSCNVRRGKQIEMEGAWGVGGGSDVGWEEKGVHLTSRIPDDSGAEAGAVVSNCNQHSEWLIWRE